MKPKMFMTMKETLAMHRWTKLLNKVCDIFWLEARRLMAESDDYKHWKHAADKRQKAAVLSNKYQARFEKAMGRVLKCQGHPTFVNKKGA